jgi:proteasome lid subunit RPN8/RPN11
VDRIVSGRIEVDRSLPPATMPARLLNELREHAREAHPEECCGLLVGKRPGHFSRVHRCRNEMTRLHRADPLRHPRDGRKAFHMNEVDYMNVTEEAEAEGLRVTAVYHSHADAAAYFSELDQRFALEPGFPFPDAAHLVISVVDGLVRETAIFQRLAGTDAFSGRLLVSEAP